MEKRDCPEDVQKVLLGVIGVVDSAPEFRHFVLYTRAPARHLRLRSYRRLITMELDGISVIAGTTIYRPR